MLIFFMCAFGFLLFSVLLNDSVLFKTVRLLSLYGNPFKPHWINFIMHDC